MPFSAKTALIEARPHIDAARQAGNTKDIIKHYQDAKSILTQVNPKEEDAPSLKDMADAFLELADVLECKGSVTQDKAEKCRRRADDFKNVSLMLMNLFNPKSELAFVDSKELNKRYPFVATVTRQSSSTPQSIVSLSAVSGSSKTLLLFSKNVDRETFVCHLPAPGEQLESTHQLAYCLTLLQESFDGTSLDPDTRDWRHKTLKNSEETIRMEEITRQVVREFIEDSEKNATVIEEVIQLVQVLDKETSQSLLRSLVDTTSKSTLLHLHAMKGLAKVIQGATPRSIDSNDLVTILRVLYERLQTVHNPSTSHLYSLLVAVSRVLDAMVVAQFGDVDRVTIHGPLTVLLHELESHQNLCVAFQAEYATQALLNISDNDTIWQAGFRRGWLVLKGAAGFAKMPDPREIKDALETLENIYKAGKGTVRVINNTLVAVKTGEKFEFSAKEGLKFKRIWYPTLRNAEEYVQTGDLIRFQELVTTAACRHQLMFQTGICQLLGRFAGDTQWDLEARQSTVAFLEALCRDDCIWTPQEGIHQIILDLTSIMDFDVRGSNIESSIRLEQLFDKRILRNGEESIPQRILVQGRAGIGKTTLRKKIVHLHQSGLWAERFEAVLWLPLRHLKALRGPTCRTLQSLLREMVFTAQFGREPEELVHALAIRAYKGKVLFILDGLDEIIADVQSEDNSKKVPLKVLLDQKHVVITSRPSGLDVSSLQSIDLELETIGFSQKDVKEFIGKVLAPGPARKVQDFIQQTPLIQGLVNIPVQLDVICFCWESFPQDGSHITITLLYQLMSRKLWCKDALRLKKDRRGKILTEKQIKNLSEKEIDHVISTELRHLGHLAFNGLKNDHQIEFDEAALLGAFQNLGDNDSADDNTPYSSEVLDMVKETSFLHSADAGLDTGKKSSPHTWSFLHLTFQEYFAATWIASELTNSGRDGQRLSSELMKVEPTARFVQRHKYNPRFEIVWWMVAGLLQGEALTNFFRLVQETPRDLIGGRHQQLLASCLNEARTRLDAAVIARLDMELLAWLNFEIDTCHKQDSSLLGRRISFPEGLLLKSLDSVCSRKSTLVRTLGARSTFSEPATQFLVSALMDEDEDVKLSAVWALGKQSTLPESAIQSLTATLKDENTKVKISAVEALSKQSALPESAIQPLIATLKDEDANVRKSAAYALGNRRSTLSESAIHSLIAALKDKDTHVRGCAAEALRSQSILSESDIQSLIAALKDENRDVRKYAAESLSNQSTLPESAIRSLIATLKDGDQYVRMSAAEALGNQSTLPEPAIQSLVATLKDRNGYVRKSAAEALSKQSTLPESAIQSLIATLTDESADTTSHSILFEYIKKYGNPSRMVFYVGGVPDFEKETRRERSAKRTKAPLKAKVAMN
ncbi:hypothetical protein EC991_000505 [Linnemannia zychae]|nr:hypothetical protein EC991_000505 [Linnemannia zychae]